MIRVSEAIKHDHRELEDYYSNILTATSDDEKTRWQNQFTWELARHSVGEELIVYPAMEKHLANGKAMADKDREEHQKVSLIFFCYNLRCGVLTITIITDANLGQGTAVRVPEHESL